MDLEFYTPCHFGLEAVLKREVGSLGYDITEVEDGRVSFRGDEDAIARANIFLRTTERVMIKVGEFKAYTWDQLFEGIRALPWEQFIPENGRFWVKKANSIKSRLFSPSDIQSIAKKAMVERLKETYHISHFPEDGQDYPVRISILKDRVTVGLDTTGTSLHKRGYRTLTALAPISETLAAALIMLTPWHSDRILVDPFCGSGTFPIEAALIGAGIAPGINRSFTAESWSNFVPERVWRQAREEATSLVKQDVEMHIQGYDIDGEVIKNARENARAAGVEQYIHFQQRPVAELSHPKKYGFIITNPPYGERLEDRKDLPALYSQLGRAYNNLDAWSLFMITAFEDAEKYIGRRADKKRKIYNGMIKTCFYQFMGPRPPKRHHTEEKS